MRPLLAGLAFLVLSLLGGVVDAQKGLPCADNPDLLHNKKGKLVWFTSDELKKRAISQVPAKFPPSCRCRGTIIVYVQINTEGEVVCTKTLNGNPLLQVASLISARQWKFKPALNGDKPVAVVGWLAFHFSPEGKVF
jgi:hypothetical protein